MAGSPFLYSQQTDRLISARKMEEKPDRLEEFRALQKEISEAWEKQALGLEPTERFESRRPLGRLWRAG